MNEYKLYDDAELINLLNKGDKVAFTEIFERYHKSLYLNIMRVIRHETEAEDILQSVFEVLWDKRVEIEKTKSVGGWLFTLSYCRTVDNIRKKVREKKRLLQIELPTEQYIEETSFEDYYDKLEELIAKLSPQKRRVFEKCKLEGKTYEKVAKELGISKYTVSEYLKDSMSFIKREMLTESHRNVATTITFVAFFLFLS